MLGLKAALSLTDMIERISFSTADLNYSTAPDCVMPPDDPIYNNLSAREAKHMDLPKIDNSNRGEIQRRQNIRPGSEKWFELWFKDAR
jgi:hypothetical protein